MPAHHNKLKLIEFSLTPPDGGSGTPVQFECQVSTWELQNNTDDPEQHFTFCPDGSFYESADPSYALAMTFYSDWRSDGISDFVWSHKGEVVSFTLNHHPDIPDENVKWTGTCRVKAPNVGGDARTTEVTEATFPILGEPTYERVQAA